MKRKLCLLTVVLAVLALLPLGCGGDPAGEVSRYDWALTFEEENKTLSGTGTVSCLNQTQNPQTEIRFSLYQNAFRDPDNPPVSAVYRAKAFPNGKSSGEIEIASVTVGGEPADFALSENGMQLVLKLGEELFPGERLEVGMSFTIRPANALHRTGWGPHTVNFGNCLPILARCGAEGYDDGTYYSTGDPFVSETADFSVSLTLPEGWTAAASCALEEEEGVLKGEASRMRDFALVLSKEFTLTEQAVGDTLVRYYSYQDEDPEKSLQVAVDALTTFNELFGLYPYPTFSVVQTGFVYGGMEYPGLVLISDTCKNEELYEVIIHETAHQWWYGVVGSDQVRHAWQDEGLTEYSVLLFYEENPEYGVTREEFVAAAQKSYSLFCDVYAQILGEIDVSMDRALPDFLTELEYSTLTYTRSVLMYDQAREGMGKKRFLNGLKKYYSSCAYQVADPATLLGCLDAAAGFKVSKVLEQYLDGNVVG